jgi:hypothetical protein
VKKVSLAALNIYEKISTESRCKGQPYAPLMPTPLGGDDCERLKARRPQARRAQQHRHGQVFHHGPAAQPGEVREPDDDPYVGVSILAVDTQAVKAGGLDHIQKYIDEHKRLPYVQFAVQATLKEALNCFKRFEVVLHSKFRGVEEYVRTFPDED